MELFWSFHKILSAVTYGKIVMTLLSSKNWSGSFKAKFKVWNMLKVDKYNKKSDTLCILPARHCNPQFPIFARKYGLETTYSRDCSSINMNFQATYSITMATRIISPIFALSDWGNLIANFVSVEFIH